jgi:predicted nucleic acid-binding Zn ribbon protein
MPMYSIRCKECNYETVWNCTIKNYEKRLKEKCPQCNKKKLYQYFGDRDTVPIQFVGFGWTRKQYRKGSQNELDQELKNHDYLQMVSEKNNNQIPEKIAKQYRDENKIK